MKFYSIILCAEESVFILLIFFRRKRLRKSNWNRDTIIEAAALYDWSQCHTIRKSPTNGVTFCLTPENTSLYLQH